MSKSFSAFLGLPVAALAGAGLSFSFQDPGAGAPDLSQSLATVDAIAVINAYPAAMAGQASLQKLATDFQAEMALHEQKIQQLELDIGALAPGTREQKLKTLQLDQAKRLAQGLINLHFERMQGDTTQFTVDMYEAFLEAVDKVAVAKGLKVVLRVRKYDPSIPAELRRASNDRRTVLFAAPELDVTQDVINMLKVAEGPGR
jgi:Skp family chaperone for outer membrane proteins